jgi:hypothetical protein
LKEAALEQVIIQSENTVEQRSIKKEIMKMKSKVHDQEDDSKRYIIVQAQLEGEVALTKPDIYENVAKSFKRFQVIDIPFIKIVEHAEWKKKQKKIV